jgi:hypothetical protein
LQVFELLLVPYPADDVEDFVHCDPVLNIILNLLGAARNRAVFLVISFFKRRSVRGDPFYKTDNNLLNMFKIPVRHGKIIWFHKFQPLLRLKAI